MTPYCCLRLGELPLALNVAVFGSEALGIRMALAVAGANVWPIILDCSCIVLESSQVMSSPQWPASGVSTETPLSSVSTSEEKTDERSSRCTEGSEASVRSFLYLRKPQIAFLSLYCRVLSSLANAPQPHD